MILREVPVFNHYSFAKAIEESAAEALCFQVVHPAVRCLLFLNT